MLRKASLGVSAEPCLTCRLSDLVGADINLHVGANFLESFPERVYRAAMMKLMNDKKMLGEKTGGGFYKFDAKRKASPNPDIKPVIAESRKVRDPTSQVQRYSMGMHYPCANGCFQERRLVQGTMVGQVMSQGTTAASGRGSPTWPNVGVLVKVSLLCSSCFACSQVSAGARSLHLPKSVSVVADRKAGGFEATGGQPPGHHRVHLLPGGERGVPRDC